MLRTIAAAVFCSADKKKTSGLFPFPAVSSALTTDKPVGPSYTHRLSGEAIVN